jgi:hypothetical protein
MKVVDLKRAWNIQMRCVPSLAATRLADRHAGMLSLQMRTMKREDAFFNCRMWPSYKATPTAQVYEREKDASMTRK